MPRNTTNQKTSKPTIQTLEDRLVPNALSGTVYADINANRLHDAGEMGLAGAQVSLDNGSDGTIDVVVYDECAGTIHVPGCGRPFGNFDGLATGEHHSHDTDHASCPVQ